jgi:hypothetical protein
MIGIRPSVAGAAVFAMLIGIASAPFAGPARADDLPAIGCQASDKIDGSTAPEAAKKIEAAGYTQVTQLKKGCDNWWHGVAVKDGVATHVSLSPQGQVRSEGD